jgi:uncharacterized protein
VARRTTASRYTSLAVVDLDALRDTVAADHAVADPAHDLSHLDRVAGLAGWIAERMGVPDKLARIAAYVHDYHRVAEARTGVRPLPANAANDLVRAVLVKHRVPRRWHPDVLCAVDATGRYRIAGHALPAELAEVCPVAAIVHDADNLDALGVVGLARAVGYGTVLGEPLWEPGAAIRATYTDGLTSSVLAHCYEKLVHLADEMLTEPGRALARVRLADLLGVLGRLRTELAGDPAGQRSTWDPRTGYLRLALGGPGPVQVDCRLAFTADARIGLRAGAAGPQVCYLELSGLPPVARAAVAAVEGVLVRGDGLRIPVRLGMPGQVAVGSATVELELVGDRPNAVTLHMSGAAPEHDGMSMIAG